jgi:hypothetical protein
MVGDRRTNDRTCRHTPTQRKVTSSTTPWSRIPTHMLGMPAMGNLGQARAYSSDSKDDDIPDLGLGFQSLGSLFPTPPAPGRYSRPRERRAEEEAMSSKREEKVSSGVSQQEMTPPHALGRYSQPQDKKAEEEAAEKETIPPPKAPFFGSVASEQSNAPEQAGETRKLER